MTFGKRFAPPSRSNNLAEKLDEDFDLYSGLPWEGVDYAPCNYAVGFLRDYLWSALSPAQGRPHPETLFSAIGSIAGYANQKHVFLKLREAGYMIAPPAIDTSEARNGITLYKGTALSVGLIEDSKNKQKRLEFWPIIRDAALASGMEEDSQPSLDGMKKHVDEQDSAPKFTLRVGMHEQPKVEVHELLKLVWPLAERVFSGEIEPDSNYGRVKTPFMCAVCGFVVQHYMEIYQNTFPAGAGLLIAMESALYASKLPASILD